MISTLNRLAVLRLIRKLSPSRADLARNTGLTRAAISVIVDGLIKDGLVLEGEKNASENGRKPTSLMINKDAFTVLGADVTRKQAIISLSDATGNVIATRTVKLLPTLDETVNAMTHAMMRLKRKDTLGIGISTPGPVDTVEGRILCNTGIKIFDNACITELIKEKMQLPVILEKDAITLAIAEKNVQSIDNFAFLLADEGLGCAVIKDGVPFKGAGGFGCELGHVTINRNGARCHCGNYGCAETYLSVPVTVKNAGAKSYSTLVKKAISGERYYLGALITQGEYLADVILTLKNLFEPEQVVLGGALKEAAPILIGVINRRLHECSFTARRLTVTASKLTNEPFCHAGGLVLEKFFEKGYI